MGGVWGGIGGIGLKKVLGDRLLDLSARRLGGWEVEIYASAVSKKVSNLRP
jgi:hypothetical protein